MSARYVQESVAQRQGSQPRRQGLVENSFWIHNSQHGDEPQIVYQQHQTQASQQEQEIYTQSRHIPQPYPSSSDFTPNPHYVHGNPRSGLHPNQYPNSTTDTSTPELIPNEQTSYLYQKLDPQHEAQQLFTQQEDHQRRHSYSNPFTGYQPPYYAVYPSPKSHTSELMYALQLNSHLSQPSSLPPVPIPWSNEVVLDNSEENSDKNCSEFSDTRPPSVFATFEATNDDTPSVNYNHSDLETSHHKLCQVQGDDTNGASDNLEISADIQKLARNSKKRTVGACVHCQKAKLKCHFQEGKTACKRCELRGRACVVEAKNSKVVTNRRDYLLAQIKQKDTIIESLLKQLHDPYNSTPMSIASYLTGTSPSDHNNMNLREWVARLQPAFGSTNGHGGRSALREGATSSDANSRNGSPQTPDTASSGNDTGARQKQDLHPINELSPLLNLHTPWSMIAELSLNDSDGKKARDLSKDETSGENVGVANKAYFESGPATDLDARMAMIEQHNLPEIILHGLVTSDDVDRFFDRFHEHINPLVPLLDPVLHTPKSTFARCPFLYNIICAISSRYDIYKSDFYPVAMHYATQSAASALINGWKSVELCQAYILMSMYAVPTQRWEEDRSWLYTGLAIRIATDLNLHQVSTTQPQNEKEEREMLNQMRVWLVCCNLDLSTTTHYGKPPAVREDHIPHNIQRWYSMSKYNFTHDIHWCARLVLLRVVDGFRDQALNSPLDSTGLKALCSNLMDHDARLTSYHEEWLILFSERSDVNDVDHVFRLSLLAFLVGHSRLVMYSFAFDQICQRGIRPSDLIYFTRILEASKFVIGSIAEKLAPTGYMRYAPDEYFIIPAFASVFLIKLLRPEFSEFISEDQESEILELIGRLTHALSSQNIAVDDRHTPKLYARFLADLVSRHCSKRNSQYHRLEQGDNLSAQWPTQYAVGAAPLNLSAAANEGERDQARGQGFSFGFGFGDQVMGGAPIYQPRATHDFGTDIDLHFWESSAF